MTDSRQLEFFLLRYVTDAVKGEFINFGLVTIGNGAEVIDVRFTKDRSRILCLDPQADLAVLNSLQREIEQEIGRSRDRALLLRKMEDSFSGVIQMSAVMPALTDKSVVEEIKIVAQTFLETAKVRREHEPAGHKKIRETMRDAFEKAGVLELLNEIPTEPYTKTGDPLRFDFGYRIGNELKIFQAVSMKASVDSAVLLAARYPKIASSMAQIAAVTPMLTGVIESDLDKSRSEVEFALEMMGESGIVVAETTHMPNIAETARRELNV